MHPLCKPVAMACNGMQLGAPCARHPHEKEAESYANAFMMYASVSRLHQGLALLSGLLSHHIKKKRIIRDPLASRITRKELVLQYYVCNRT